MTERAYTVAEIDALRAAVWARLWDASLPPALRQADQEGVQFCTTFVMGESESKASRTRRIEEHVRTHMLAGHTAADIRDQMRRDREQEAL